MQIQKTFFIYDYETFGKNPAIDRPAQFAGIRTNNNFQYLESPKSFLCKISKDYLPNPESVLISNITPQETLLNGIPEFEFAKNIYDNFNQANTCIIGYNNIHFDDEISRNIFYRNFLDPYSWSWKNGNSRWDLLKVMRAMYALRPEGIVWPISHHGTPSFKLQDITYHNNIIHYKPHDAVEDIYATIKLAKLIKKAQPKLFNYLYFYKNKKELKTLIDIKTIKPLLYVTNNFNIDTKNICCIAPLTWHPINPNILISYDLNISLETLLDINIHKLKEQLNFDKIINHKYNAIPLKFIYLNKCPTLTPISALRSQDLHRVKFEKKKYLNQLQYLKKHHKEIIKKIYSLLNNNQHFEITSLSNVDKQLYNGFFNYKDQLYIKYIQNTKPENLNKIQINFTDKRLKYLLFNYRSRNFPETLNKIEQNIWKQHIKQTYNSNVLRKYYNKLITLIKTNINSKQKNNILIKLYEYYKNFINL